MITSSRRFRQPRPPNLGSGPSQNSPRPLIRAAPTQPRSFAHASARFFRLASVRRRHHLFELVLPLAVIREGDQLLNCFGFPSTACFASLPQGESRFLRVVLRNIIRTSATGSHLDELPLRLCVAFPASDLCFGVLSFVEKVADGLSFLGFHQARHQPVCLPL